jgi:uroporphyrinogen decarboxylase
MTNFNHRERIERCLGGERSDRTPIALWRHFPVDDQDPGRLAAAISHFQRTFEFDFIKVTPASSFCIKDYGATDIWKGDPEGTREYQGTVVREASGWHNLLPLEPTKNALGSQLECLRLLRQQFSTSTPILQTIFSPIAQAKNLVGKGNLIAHIHGHPEELIQGLNVLLHNTLDFIEESKKLHIDGIFYAMQFAQHDLITDDEFDRFFRPYDLEILGACKELWLNVLHLHGEDVRFESVIDYPAAVVNWHDLHTPPSLSEGLKTFPGIVCGGIRQWESLVYGDPLMVKNEIQDAIASTDGLRYIIGTGCVTPIIAPYGNIIAALDASNSNY